MWVKVKPSGELYHHGIKGQRWGHRNYQYEDGRLTPEGKERYSTSTGRKLGSLSRRGEGLGTGPVGSGPRPQNTSLANARSSYNSYKKARSEWKIQQNTNHKVDDITRNGSSNSDSSAAWKSDGQLKNGWGYHKNDRGQYVVYVPEDKQFYTVDVGDAISQDVLDANLSIEVEKLRQRNITYNPVKDKQEQDLVSKIKDAKRVVEEKMSTIPETVTSKAKQSYKKASSAVSNAVKKIGSALTSIFKKR